jgi:hypothetical protein
VRPLLAVLLLTLASAAYGQAPEVRVHTKLDPNEGVVIGQPVNLFVDVFFLGAMAHPPRVTIPQAAGAQIMRFESQGVTIRGTIDGKAAVGQEFTFVVMPRRGGSLSIPAPDVTLLDRTGEVFGSAQGRVQTLEVTVPPGIDASSPVIASTAVTAKESWSPDPKAALQAGGALVRTIQREAADVPALGMADFVFRAPEGVRVYVDPPESADRVNRGAVTGRRSDRVTYVFEKAGRYDLPALAQPWWDLGAREAKRETLPGVAVSVRPAPVYRNRQFETDAARLWPRIAEVFGTAVALCLLFVLGRWVTPFWRERLETRAASEACARRELQRAAKGGDSSATYRALELWLSRLDARSRDMARRAPPLAPAIETLERALFGSGAWSADQAGQFAAAIGDFDAMQGAGHGRQVGALPPLNPAKRQPRADERT